MLVKKIPPVSKLKTKDRFNFSYLVFHPRLIADGYQTENTRLWGRQRWPRVERRKWQPSWWRKETGDGVIKQKDKNHSTTGTEWPSYGEGEFCLLKKLHTALWENLVVSTKLNFV